MTFGLMYAVGLSVGLIYIVQNCPIHTLMEYGWIFFLLSAFALYISVRSHDHLAALGYLAGGMTFLAMVHLTSCRHDKILHYLLALIAIVVIGLLISATTH